MLDDAGAYRDKQPGLWAIHHLLAAHYIFYKIKIWYIIVNDDNQGIINISLRNLRTIQPGSSYADILWYIRNTSNNMSTIVKYQHVDGHMDMYLFF